MGTEKKEDKNISVTLVTPKENDGNEVTISFSSIFNYLKRFFVLWLCIAIIAGLLSIGIGIIRQKTTHVGDVTALISLNYDGADQGLDPDGNKLDITKIKSPSIINEALNEIDIDESASDKVRQNISITGIVPKDAMDKLSLYYKSFSSSNGNSLQAAQSLLDSKYNSTEYIITLNYFGCGMSLEQGNEILNAVLNRYRDYFFTTYSYNTTLGSSINVIDYKSYDYAEATNIFSSNLDAITEYVTNLKNNDNTNFRSSETGYSFDDLLKTAQTLKNNDLDRVTSYITINNVTSNNVSSMLSYYNYLIEELNRKKDVSQSQLDSINDSIKNYEKDPLILVVGDNNENSTTPEGETKTTDNQTDLNKEYDDLCNQRISVQKDISDYNKDIKYYTQIVNSFKSAKKVDKKDIKVVESYLKSLDSKLNELIKNVNETADEYYTKVAFADSFKILVPASGEESSIVSNKFVTIFAIIEGVWLVIYLLIGIIGGIVSANKKPKTENLKSDESTAVIEDKNTGLQKL